MESLESCQDDLEEAPELRERAVRMVSESSGERVAVGCDGRGRQLLGVGAPETVRKWVGQAGVEAGRRSGATTEESAELEPAAAG